MGACGKNKVVGKLFQVDIAEISFAAAVERCSQTHKCRCCRYGEFRGADHKVAAVAYVAETFGGDSLVACI